MSERITYPKVPRDTRGLPMDMDPHSFYEYASDKVVANSTTALEMLIWRLIPYSYIRSFAIAIDPLYKFKVSPGRITRPNRTRYKTRIDLTQSIVGSYTDTRASYHNSTTPLGCNRDDYQQRSGSTVTYPIPGYKPTKGLTSYCKDTTARTRDLRSNYGEAEWFRFSIASPGRTAHRSEKNIFFRSGTPGCGSLGFPSSLRRLSTVDLSYSVSGGGYLTQSTIDAIATDAKNASQSFMASRGMETVRRAMPTHRSFSLGRSILELKDVPRSVASARDLARTLSELYKHLPRSVFDLKSAVSSVPDQYLSYHFGWKQLVGDIMSLLDQPARVQRRINRLITRNGLPTTYRGTTQEVDAYVRGSGFSYVNIPADSNIVLSHRVERRKLLRCSISAKFEFPPTDIVKFRRTKFFEMIGASPSPVDFYKIVPWTWLFDWFTGFGNYLSVIEEITSDRSLVNHGFIACECNGSLITNHRANHRSYLSIDINGASPLQTFVSVSNHSSSLDFSYYVRKDVTGLTNIKSTAEPSSLTTFQRTILGALFAQHLRH